MSQNKQDDIFEAAMQLFAKRGYDGTTVPMIADKAKVGAGTIYRYFDNKESLVNALFIKCFTKYSDTIKHDFPINSTVREKHLHIYNRIFEFARNNFDAFLFINSHDDGYYLDDNSNKAIEEFLDIFRPMIEEGKEKGIINASLPVFALIAIVYGPIVLVIKMLEKEDLTYTPELVKELEESSWNAIRIK